jgi:hypothetical protein
LQNKKSSDLLSQSSGLIAMEEFHSANFRGFCLINCGVLGQIGVPAQYKSGTVVNIFTV